MVRIPQRDRTIADVRKPRAAGSAHNENILAAQKPATARLAKRDIPSPSGMVLLSLNLPPEIPFSPRAANAARRHDPRRRAPELGQNQSKPRRGGMGKPGTAAPGGRRWNQPSPLSGRQQFRSTALTQTLDARNPTVFHNPAVQPSHRSARRRAKPPENLLAQHEGIAGLCQSMYQKIQRNPMQTKILRLTYFFSRIANTMKPARDCFEGFYGFERQNFFTNLKPARTRNTEGFRKFF